MVQVNGACRLAVLSNKTKKETCCLSVAAAVLCQVPFRTLQRYKQVLVNADVGNNYEFVTVSRARRYDRMFPSDRTKVSISSSHYFTLRERKNVFFRRKDLSDANYSARDSQLVIGHELDFLL